MSENFQVRIFFLLPPAPSGSGVSWEPRVSFILSKYPRQAFSSNWITFEETKEQFANRQSTWWYSYSEHSSVALLYLACLSLHRSGLQSLGRAEQVKLDLLCSNGVRAPQCKGKIPLKQGSLTYLSVPATLTWPASGVWALASEETEGGSNLEIYGCRFKGFELQC